MSYKWMFPTCIPYPVPYTLPYPTIYPTLLYLIPYSTLIPYPIPCPLPYPILYHLPYPVTYPTLYPVCVTKPVAVSYAVMRQLLLTDISSWAILLHNKQQILTSLYLSSTTGRKPIYVKYQFMWCRILWRQMTLMLTLSCDFQLNYKSGSKYIFLPPGCWTNGRGSHAHSHVMHGREGN